MIGWSILNNSHRRRSGHMLFSVIWHDATKRDGPRASAYPTKGNCGPRRLLPVSAAMASPLFDLSGRVAVITGTSRGIGRALAHGFAQAGAIVVGCARSYEAAEATAAEIRAKGGEALGVLADVTKPEDCQALVDNAVRRYGRLDIAVLNAGTNIAKPAI